MAGRKLTRPTPMRDAVDLTLSALGQLVTPSDRALAALARSYANALDDAQALADDCAELADRAAAEGADDVYLNLRKLGRKADVVEILASLGPKLQAALVELGATPRARATKPAAPGAPAAAQPGPVGPMIVTPGGLVPAPVGSLDAMRQRRAAEQSAGQ